MNVTVGGLPGTGTSTLCRILQARLDLPYTYAGEIFRDEAAKRGMDLAEFGRLCQEDPEVDQSLDDQQLELLRQGDQLLEGRLAGWLAHRHGVEALKVWLVCDDEERLRRVAERDGGSIEDQSQRIREREQSEVDRYQRYYGADLGNLSIYDLVLDSTDLDPDGLADAVETAYAQRADAL